MKGAVPAVVVIACAISFAGANGCFFNPRDPEVGGVDTTTSCKQQAISPQILRENVRCTFEARQVTAYMESFLEDFEFHPAAEDSGVFANQGRFPFEGYDEVVEEQVTQLVFGTSDRIRLSFLELDPPVFQQGGDTARMDLRYELSVIDSTGTGVDSVFYGGVLTFLMRDVTDGWGLYAWIDSRSGEPGIRSWSALRGNTRP